MASEKFSTTSMLSRTLAAHQDGPAGPVPAGALRWLAAQLAVARERRAVRPPPAQRPATGFRDRPLATTEDFGVRNSSPGRDPSTLKSNATLAMLLVAKNTALGSRAVRPPAPRQCSPARSRLQRHAKGPSAVLRMGPSTLHNWFPEVPVLSWASQGPAGAGR